MNVGKDTEKEKDSSWMDKTEEEETFGRGYDSDNGVKEGWDWGI